MKIVILNFDFCNLQFIVCNLRCAMVSPQLQRTDRDQPENNANDPESDDDLRFSPTFQFKMVVNGCHPENPLLAQLIRDNLDDDRKGLDHKNPAHND